MIKHSRIKNELSHIGVNYKEKSSLASEFHKFITLVFTTSLDEKHGNTLPLTSEKNTVGDNYIKGGKCYN